MDKYAMCVNGPKAGHTIKLSEPIPEQYNMAIAVITCNHRPDMSSPFLNVVYKVNKHLERDEYFLTTDTNIDELGYVCMQCREEAKIKYRLDKIKDIIFQDQNEEDDDDQWN